MKWFVVHKNEWMKIVITRLRHIRWKSSLKSEQIVDLLKMPEFSITRFFSSTFYINEGFHTSLYVLCNARASWDLEVLFFSFRH